MEKMLNEMCFFAKVVMLRWMMEQGATSRYAEKETL